MIRGDSVGWRGKILDVLEECFPSDSHSSRDLYLCFLQRGGLIMTITTCMALPLSASSDRTRPPVWSMRTAWRQHFLHVHVAGAFQDEGLRPSPICSVRHSRVHISNWSKPISCYQSKANELDLELTRGPPLVQTHLPKLRIAPIAPELLREQHFTATTHLILERYQLMYERKYKYRSTQTYGLERQ